ncbi:MAG: hypothetical protein JNN07_19450, partial [Verrucomicrobiales bacterium]|nr:hypothetical protein [Verrucomicrobiales bacterium]
MSINYHRQIQAYESEKVNLSDKVREDLYSKRDTNRNRLKANLPERVKISSFISQGSMAIRTTVQEENQDYDIDDGVSFHAETLTLEKADMTARETQEMVRDALKNDDRLKKPPEIIGNCVRVFYREGYHVDVPSFRVYRPGEKDERQELAGENGWRASDPTEINAWFERRVQELNRIQEDAGGQFRRMIRLLKRFARSRGDKWDLPNGLKLTMLADECFERSLDRDDRAFFDLLQNLANRLQKNLIVLNRAQSKEPQDQLTKSDKDPNMIELKKRVNEALEKLAVTRNANSDQKATREPWDWV